MSDTYQTETSRYRHLCREYCVCRILISEIPGETPVQEFSIQPGCGIDVASQGDPVVPWAWQLDLPKDEFAHYNSNHEPHGPIQLRGHADKLPVEDRSLDFVYSSHLLEDYADWTPVLLEWVRVLKPGGFLVILIPDRERWLAACAAGQPPNDMHRHEANGPAELAGYSEKIGCKVVECRFTDCHPGDYTILGVFKKL